MDPNAEIAEGFQAGIMPHNYAETLPAQIDALVKYLKEVAGKWSRVRAPGLIRGGVFFVIGVLFAAAIVLGVRAAYGFPSPRRH